MEQKNQQSLFDRPAAQRRQIIYVSPNSEVLDKYAHSVCKAYAAKHSKGALNTEFVQGFKSFVRAVAKARVSQLNKGVEL